MTEKNTIRLSSDTIQMMEEYFSVLSEEKNLQADNEKTINTALIYEKFRVALEYQEEHLIFKNAIARILRRHYTLSINPDTDFLYTNLINELSWSNYLNPETLKEIEISKIKRLISHYLILLKHANSGRFKKHEVQKMVIEWLSAEIEEILKPQSESKIFIDYTYSILNKNISIKNTKVTTEENKIQLKIAIYNLLYKPDLSLMQLLVLKHIYTDWDRYTEKELKTFARSFDPYFNKVDAALNHRYRKRYIQYVKRYIAPFLLYKKVISAKNINLDPIKENPVVLQSMIMDCYNTEVIKASQKVWRATMRALIFIFITKISLAFILEIPFDRYMTGKIDYFSLIVNISLPPLLMFAAGTSVKSPSKKNYKLISDTFMSIILENKINDEIYSLLPRSQNKSFRIFSYIYSVFTFSIVIGAIWLLSSLNFNIVSIILFFLFVSIVSFFAFRIRNIALELAMKRNRDDAVTSFVELIFLPFIRIGKFFSDRFAAFNPLMIALDFLIEAPLKTIIKIISSWLKFINAKKEELES